MRQHGAVTDERAEACRVCGAVRRPDDPPWTIERERGRVRVICPDCTRRHARDIESGLPAEYW
jgi:hypothetical protein